MPAKLIFLFLHVLLFSCDPAIALQKKWTGPLTGDWENASNWQPVGIPAAADDVILDNSIQPNTYTVLLPVTNVVVYTILIEPAAGNQIELTLTASNQKNPAVAVNGPGNCITIRNGGVFRNSSGLTMGSSIQLNGLLCINNGGRYIHNSRSSHATDILAKLSAATGTEKGAFEFDVPGGSYPISLSNRVYGSLILSSAASGGSQTYNASGANPAIINGNFSLGSGVQFNLDLANDMIINGNYMQAGGTFNIASQPNNTTVKINGSVQQAASGMITETSNGLPVLELCGKAHQEVSFNGTIENNVTLKMNNSKGVQLNSPLKLFYHLVLTDGIIKTSALSPLIIADNGTIAGGSETSFIEGPLRKIGDDDFEFPVGKQGDYAPVRMLGSGGAVTDEFLAEYFLADPALDYGTSFENPPLVRISRLEYWALQRLAGSASKKISLYVGKYSNATDLEKLVVVGWNAPMNLWKNEGNSFYTGVAVGTIISNSVNGFGVFTIGSTVQGQNPLPVSMIKTEEKRIPDLGHALKIFPTLVKDRLFIQGGIFKKESIRIEILTGTGQRVMRLNYPVIGRLSTITVPVAHLSNGSYIIGVYSNEKLVGSRRFIKM